MKRFDSHAETYPSFAILVEQAKYMGRLGWEPVHVSEHHDGGPNRDESYLLVLYKREIQAWETT